MSPFGLDIGESSVKVVHLEKQGEKFTLLAAGITATPPNLRASSNEKDFVTLAQAIKKLITDTKIESAKANISLPESQVFTRLVQLPLLTDEEIASAISWQAEPYIPIPIESASIDYQVVGRREAENGNPGGVDVLLVATGKDLIAKYLKILEFAGLSAVNIESDLLALSRSVAPQGQVAVLVDIGSSSTNIGIVDSGQLVVSRSVATGGSVLTRALITGLSVSAQQAEEYKKTYGLEARALEGKVKLALEPALKLVVDEIKKTIAYYKSDVGKNKSLAVAVLSGGTAGMPEFSVYLARELGIEVMLGDPFAKIIKNPQTDKQLSSWSPLYAVACGLAQNI